MGRFLAIYNGVATEEQKQELSAAQQQQFMIAWGQWAAAHKAALVDPGAPLYRKRRVTSTGVDEFTDSKTGYAIVVADSHDAAVEIFSSHPHLSLTDGNSIEVIECPPIPT